MSDLNRFMCIGRLGKDPEIRYAANGNAIANLTVASSETWKNKTTGERQEKTEWTPVVIFGKRAEIAGEYLKKGSRLYVEGKKQTRKWQDNEGRDRYSVEIVIDAFNGYFQMLDNKTDNAGNTQAAQPGSRQRGQDKTFDENNPRPSSPPAPPAQDFDDDIPF